MIDTLRKGRGGVKPGQIPVIREYDIPAHKRKGKPVKGFHVVGSGWVNPETATLGKKGKYKYTIDWGKIELEGIRIPAPDEINPNISPEIANKYFKLYWRGERNPNFQKRLHGHTGAEKLHAASRKHKGEKTQVYHKDELIEFEDEYFERHLKVPSWLKRYNIQVKTIPIHIKEFETKAQRYSLPGGPVVLTWKRDNVPYVYSEKYGSMRFTGEQQNVSALNEVQRIFEGAIGKEKERELELKREEESEREAEKEVERRLVKKAIGEIIYLKNFKENIIRKANNLLDSSLLKKKYIVCNDFKSGDDEVNLTGIDKNYSVSVNQIPVINTNDLKEAITKYYSEISKIINSENEDKDMALELLGERLITMNREIRPMIEKLGDNEDTTKWLKEMDFSELDFETDSNGILKFLFLPSITTAEPWKGGQVQMVPLIEEMGVPAEGYGDKPGKKELRSEDYKTTRKVDINQLPIDESADMKNKTGISPAIITH